MATKSSQSVLHRILLFLLVGAVAACGADRPRDRVEVVDPVTPVRPPERVVDPVTPVYRALAPFDSSAEFETYLDRVRAAQEAVNPIADYGGVSADASVALASPAVAEGTAADNDDSITNNQEQGVDEGDIVKAHRGYLVILRRGRLFSVRLEDAGRNDLAPVSQADTFAPGSQLGTWYDEMLISEERIIVMGYSYRVGATEIGLFAIDDEGVISHQATHFVRSNDYYSTRNYASRLVGGKLVFYMPYYLTLPRGGYCEGPNCSEDFTLPSLGREKGDEMTWTPLIKKTRIVRPIQPSLYPTLHTIVQCDLAQPSLSCEATGVLGPYSRTFYVSPEAVYVWVANDYNGPVGALSANPAADSAAPRPRVPKASAVVYRLPLTGGEITALRAHGDPIDQFSFKEGDDGHLNVLVGSRALQVIGGGLSLMRVPLSDFSAAAKTATMGRYSGLSRLEADHTLQNRFVGDHVLYGGGQGWWGNDALDGRLYIKAYKTTDAVQSLELGHGVDRIEALGSDAALVVGSDGADLKLSAVALGAVPKVRDVYIRPDAVQGETRSHGFFFKAAVGGGGVLGLPARLAGGVWTHLLWGSAEVLFLRLSTELQLMPLGTLRASADGTHHDACKVSCVDWYGNARPIFYRDRVFALLGYELVEGSLGETALAETSRADFLDTPR